MRCGTDILLQYSKHRIIPFLLVLLDRLPLLEGLNSRVVHDCFHDVRELLSPSARTFQSLEPKQLTQLLSLVKAERSKMVSGLGM